MPGGRFNEMYGWDSYFIIRGLLRAGRVDLARGMVDNFFFEIEHYGAMLNANRTYYLTRSQPPFVSSMFVDVYQAMQKKSTQSPTRPGWSAPTPISIKTMACGPAIRIWRDRRDCRVITISAKARPPRPCRMKAASTARWRNILSCIPPRPTTTSSRSNAGATQTAAARAGLRVCRILLQVCRCAATYEARAECEKATQFKLSADYYKGDRSMRESGFDVSFRFGPFGAATHHYAPVCLNSLLYKTEKDLEQISLWLGHAEDAKKWSKRAEAAQDTDHALSVERRTRPVF